MIDVKDLETNELLQFEIISSSTTMGQKLEIHLKSQNVKYVSKENFCHSVNMT